MAAAAEPGGQQMVRLRAPAEQASKTVVLGAGVDAVPAVVDLLESLGVLRVILAVVEHDRGTIAPAAFEARDRRARLAAQRDDTVEALTIGAAADALVDELAAYGVAAVHQAHHDLLSDYGPEAWGEVVAQAVASRCVRRPSLATGTDRGNEVLAHAAARLDLPMVANCIEFARRRRVRRDPRPLGWLAARGGRGRREPRAVHRRPPRRRRAAGRFARRGRTAPVRARRSIRRWPAAWSPTASNGSPGSRCRRLRSSSAAAAASAPPTASRRCRSSPTCSAASSAVRVPSPTTAGATTPTRSVRPAPGSPPTSTSRAASRVRSSTGSVRWRRRTSSPSTPTPNANMVTKAGYAVIGDLHEVVPAISAEIRGAAGSVDPATPRLD